MVCCPAEGDAAGICRNVLEDSNRARRFLKGNFRLVLSAAVSQAHEGVENIRICYREALETLDYMETMGVTGKSSLYSEVCQGTTERAPVLAGVLDRAQQLCNCVKVNEFRGARQLLQGIAGDLNQGYRSAAETRLRMLGLIGAVEPALDEARSRLELDSLPSPESWFQIKDVNVLNAQMDHMLEAFAVAAAQQKTSGPSRQREQFLQYVEEHLTDPNLNATMAAEDFEMSASYFSRLFKKSIGVGFLDYVHQNRVQLAKEKMRGDPGLPLKDIAEQVGYTALLALNRAFRKYEGVPPGVFRKQI